MQQHLSLLNKNVNTVKDVPAHEFIVSFAQHLKQASKFKIPDVSVKFATGWAATQMRAFTDGTMFRFSLLQMIN